MKKIRVVKYEVDEPRYSDDIKKIVRAFADQDFCCTPKQARDMWMMYSDSMAAGWMMIGDDDRIVETCMPYFEILD